VDRSPTRRGSAGGAASHTPDPEPPTH
jgi:hypothetical protein